MPALRSHRVAEDTATRVLELGLACCAMEVESAVRQGLLVPDGDGPVRRTVLLVSGTVTEPLVPVVEAAVTAAASADSSVSVVAFGACAGTGGPYWDAPSVVNGADRVVPVALYVPGCPPRPDALIDALMGRGVAS